MKWSAINQSCLTQSWNIDTFSNLQFQESRVLAKQNFALKHESDMRFAQLTVGSSWDLQASRLASLTCLVLRPHGASFPTNDTHLHRIVIASQGLFKSDTKTDRLNMAEVMQWRKSPVPQLLTRPSKLQEILCVLGSWWCRKGQLGSHVNWGLRYS